MTESDLFGTLGSLSHSIFPAQSHDFTLYVPTYFPDTATRPIDSVWRWLLYCLPSSQSRCETHGAAIKVDYSGTLPMNGEV